MQKNSIISTPHIKAKSKNEIASTVLMPGDPLRAKYIADNFLENVTQFNDIRNMFGYTGKYKGVPISVMGSGMGMPSIGIYAFELFSFYGVENIIRIGSGGAYSKEYKLGDLILAAELYSETSFAKVYNGYNDDIVKSSVKLNNIIKETAINNNIQIFENRIHSSDIFYWDKFEYFRIVRDNYDCVAVEMEAFALCHLANSLNKSATAIITISDNLETSEHLDAKSREVSLNKMIDLALNSAISIT